MHCNINTATISFLNGPASWLLLQKDEDTDARAATNFIFGPLIDSPPSHLDTILTTLMHIEQFLQQNGTMLIHPSADMQMNQTVMPIKWSFPY